MKSYYYSVKSTDAASSDYPKNELFNQNSDYASLRTAISSLPTYREHYSNAPLLDESEPGPRLKKKTVETVTEIPVTVSSFATTNPWSISELSTDVNPSDSHYQGSFSTLPPIIPVPEESLISDATFSRAPPESDISWAREPSVVFIAAPQRSKASVSAYAGAPPSRPSQPIPLLSKGTVGVSPLRPSQAIPLPSKGSVGVGQSVRASSSRPVQPPIARSKGSVRAQQPVRAPINRAIPSAAEAGQKYREIVYKTGKETALILNAHKKAKKSPAPPPPVPQKVAQSRQTVTLAEANARSVKFSAGPDQFRSVTPAHSSGQAPAVAFVHPADANANSAGNSQRSERFNYLAEEPQTRSTPPGPSKPREPRQLPTVQRTHDEVLAIDPTVNPPEPQPPPIPSRKRTASSVDDKNSLDEDKFAPWGPPPYDLKPPGRPSVVEILPEEQITPPLLPQVVTAGSGDKQPEVTFSRKSVPASGHSGSRKTVRQPASQQNQDSDTTPEVPVEKPAEPKKHSVHGSAEAATPPVRSASHQQAEPSVEPASKTFSTAHAASKPAERAPSKPRASIASRRSSNAFSGTKVAALAERIAPRGSIRSVRSKNRKPVRHNQNARYATRVRKASGPSVLPFGGDGHSRPQTADILSYDNEPKADYEPAQPVETRRTVASHRSRMSVSPIPQRRHPQSNLDDGTHIGKGSKFWHLPDSPQVHWHPVQIIEQYRLRNAFFSDLPDDTVPLFRHPQHVEEVHFDGLITQRNFNRLLGELLELHTLELHLSVLHFLQFDRFNLKSIDLPMLKTLEISSRGFTEEDTSVYSMSKIYSNVIQILSHLTFPALVYLSISIPYDPDEEAKFTSALWHFVRHHRSTLEFFNIECPFPNKSPGLDGRHRFFPSIDPEIVAMDITPAVRELKLVSFHLFYFTKTGSTEFWRRVLKTQEMLEYIQFWVEGPDYYKFPYDVIRSNADQLETLSLNVDIRSFADPYAKVPIDFNAFRETPQLRTLALKGIPLEHVHPKQYLKTDIINVEGLPRTMETIKLMNLNVDKDDLRLLALENRSLRALYLDNVGTEGNLGITVEVIVSLLEKSGRTLLESLELFDSINEASLYGRQQHNQDKGFRLITRILMKKRTKPSLRAYLTPDYDYEIIYEDDSQLNNGENEGADVLYDENHDAWAERELRTKSNADGPGGTRRLISSVFKEKQPKQSAKANNRRGSLDEEVTKKQQRRMSVNKIYKNDHLTASSHTMGERSSKGSKESKGKRIVRRNKSRRQWPLVS